MIRKRKLFTETARERIIETVATITGIIGGFYGGILYGDIFEGVVEYSLKFSFAGGLVGLLFALLICGITRPRKIRNFIERMISNAISALGGILFGATVAGFFGYFLDHPAFVNIYSKDIYNSIIALNSNVGDGILIGAISGAIGCTVGSLIDSIYAFVQDIIYRFAKKEDFQFAEPSEKPLQKKA